MGTMQTTTNATAERDAARKARAMAYLQEKPPKGQGWTQKKTPYVYDRDAPAPAGASGEER